MIMDIFKGYFLEDKRNKILIFSFFLFLLIQMIPVNKENPIVSIEEVIKPTLEVQKILERSCYDCHSNQTKWPIYSYIAPMSWLIHYDVSEGRSSLNFSKWNRFSEKIKIKRSEKILSTLDDESMPPAEYVLFHPEARLTQNDKDKLVKYFLQFITKN